MVSSFLKLFFCLTPVTHCDFVYVFFTIIDLFGLNSFFSLFFIVCFIFSFILKIFFSHSLVFLLFSVVCFFFFFFFSVFAFSTFKMASLGYVCILTLFSLSLSRFYYWLFSLSLFKLYDSFFLSQSCVIFFHDILALVEFIL